MKTTTFLGGLRNELTDGRLPKAIKGVFWCVLHGMGVGGAIGGMLGVGLGALVWLVGAFIGGPVGLLVGAAIGGVCGLCGGVLGGRWGWTLGGGLGVMGATFAALRIDPLNFGSMEMAFVPLQILLIAGVFGLGAFFGWYCYRRVWDEKPGVQAAAFQDWRGRLLLNGYDRTTLLDRLFAGWAIVGTVGGIVAALYCYL